MKKQVLMLLALSTIAFAGCAKTRAEGGTDGVTHWLAACDSFAQCGELECLCGVCTTACDDNASCSMLNASAECTPPSDASCAGPAQICQRPMTSVPVDGGPSDAGEQAVCKRMDARSAGTLCGGVAGYSWDGLKCKEVLCTCAGEDCDRMYATLIDCQNATDDCAPLTMCIENSDCLIKSAECCECGAVFYEDVHAVASYQLDLHAERICDGSGCEACAVDPEADARKQFVATCGLATGWEGGACQAQDLTRLECTQEAGCNVRVARCCQCGPDPSVEELYAAPAGGSSADLFCDVGQGCCEGEPILPDDVTARCGSSGFCELLRRGRVIVPGNP